MIKTQLAKLFPNGASQAVRLPADCRFEGNEVYATRDEMTGNVVLSKQPGTKTWHDFFELLRFIEVPADFMSERPLNGVPQARGIFDDALSANKNETIDYVVHAGHRYGQLYHQGQVA